MEVRLEEVYIAPRTELEAQLAVIWQELLDVERVGVEDDFFALGGHSLLAIQVISAMRKVIGEVTIKELFDHPTIASLLGQRATGLEGVKQPEIVARRQGGRVPLSFSQERLWFIDKLSGSHAYRVPWQFRLTGELDGGALEWALRTIIHRHEVLRTVL